MIEIVGKVGKATCYAKVIEKSAVEQIKRMCNYEFTKGSSIKIMPDVHYGKGCTIGTTMTVIDKIVPNIVGVDIGCGIYTVKIGKEEINLNKIDEICQSIPSGRNLWEGRREAFDFTRLRCYRELKYVQRLKRSLGTLGGGNHFIEIDKAENGDQFLIIHSGSRNLGKQVAEIYQKLAIDLNKGKDDYFRRKNEIIREFKEQGRRSEIHKELKSLVWHDKKSTIPEDLCYLYGTYFDDYLHDLEICQKFAKRNREIIAELILERINLSVKEPFHTIHNYIDIKEKILRKGAVAARRGEKVIIPMNMRDGSIIAEGKGNPNWNYSAPHGAGRLMSRKQARVNLSLDEYKKEMKNVCTTSVNEKTLDEAPMAYKPSKDIIDAIRETVDIVDILKPIYNFKSS